MPRGQHEEVTIFEVLWQHGETTSMLPAIATITELQKQFRIRLRYLGTELVLDQRERSAATLGRGQENDLVIKGNLVSRLHARIEAGKNRFMLVDQSTNGSFRPVAERRRRLRAARRDPAQGAGRHRARARAGAAVVSHRGILLRGRPGPDAGSPKGRPVTN